MQNGNGRSTFNSEKEDVYELGSRTITESDIVNFAGISGDYYPLHTSEEFAKNSIFGKRIAHGLLTLSVTSGFWTSSKLFKNSIIAFYGISDLHFLKPVFPGDTLNVKIKIVNIEKRKNGNILTFKSETCVEESQVLTLDAKFLMEIDFSLDLL